MKYRPKSIVLHVLLLIAWSTVVILGVFLLGSGAQMTFHFGATTDALAEARDGRLLILLGSAVLLMAAVLARWMRSPSWACVLVAAPAVVVGGLTFFAGGSLFGPLSFLVMLPVALSALISVFILARPMRSDRSGAAFSAPAPANAVGATAPQSQRWLAVTWWALIVIAASAMAYYVWALLQS